MKVRIKYAKTGVMKFVGHLDMTRYFQKALKRAEFDVAFSEGFSPHMIMSFAAPLGVGLTSEAEYMDIELKTPLTTEEAVRRLNEQMVEGVRVLDMRRIEEGKAGKAMSLVAASDYHISFRHPVGLSFEEQKESFEKFLSLPSILTEKKTKKGSAQIDIRPLIYEARVEEEYLFLRVSCGSSDNLRPEMVVGEWLKFADIPFDPLNLMIHRAEVYADLSAEENAHRFVSLLDLGTVVENKDLPAAQEEKS